MSIQQQTQRYGYLITAGGTVIALIGFFFLPYITITSTMASSSSSSSSSVVYSGIQSASIQGFIWLDALLAAGILLLALLLAYSRNPFGMSKISLDKQVQRGIYTLIGAGVLSLLLQFVIMKTIPAAIGSMFSSNYPSYSSSVSQYSNALSESYNTGSWFYLFGMLVVIGGAVYALSSTRSTATASVPASSPYMPPTQYPPMNSPYQQQPTASSYQQDWQQPAQPSQSSWQQQPAAPGSQQDWQVAQDQYQPTQRAWEPPQAAQAQQPPTQYPPTQRAYPPQQTQPPYPPYPPTAPGQ